MLDFLRRRALQPGEQKRSRTAPLIAWHDGGRARWTPRDYAALAREGYQKNPVAHRCVRLIAEARALHADCILLIMASLTDAQAAELEKAAFDWGMDVLIEVHDRAELERATKLKSPLVGINNRNLHTFEVTLDTTRDLARRVPEDRLIVSESGLFTPDDLADMARYGARSFLIGEALMRQPDVEAATRAILAKPLTAQGGA